MQCSYQFLRFFSSEEMPIKSSKFSEAAKFFSSKLKSYWQQENDKEMVIKFVLKFIETCMFLEFLHKKMFSSQKVWNFAYPIESIENLCFAFLQYLGALYRLYQNRKTLLTVRRFSRSWNAARLMKNVIKREILFKHTCSHISSLK